MDRSLGPLSRRELFDLLSDGDPKISLDQLTYHRFPSGPFPAGGDVGLPRVFQNIISSYARHAGTESTDSEGICFEALCNFLSLDLVALVDTPISADLKGEELIQVIKAGEVLVSMDDRAEIQENSQDCHAVRRRCQAGDVQGWVTVSEYHRESGWKQHAKRKVGMNLSCEGKTVKVEQAEEEWEADESDGEPSGADQPTAQLQSSEARGRGSRSGQRLPQVQSSDTRGRGRGRGRGRSTHMRAQLARAQATGGNSASTQAPETGRQQRREHVLREIQHLQSGAAPELLIPRAGFIRLAAEVTQDISEEQVLFTSEALQVLQFACEDHISQLLNDGYLITIARRRVTLDPQDLVTVLRLRRGIRC